MPQQTAAWLRPSSWWRFETEAEALRVQRRWWKVIDGRRVAGARSTAQWIAWNWLGRARDLPGIGGGGGSQFRHSFDLHVAVLQQPLIVLFEQHGAG